MTQMNRLLHNTTWMMINQIFQLAVSFFVGVATVRYLGPSNYGEITYIASYVSFFSSFTYLGLETVIINRLIFYKERDGEVIASATFLRFLAGLISVLSISVLVYYMDHDPQLLKIAGIMSLRLLFSAFNTVDYWYQYKLLSKKTAIVDMAAFAIASAYRIYILVSGKNIYWFAFYETLLYLLNMLFYIPMFHRDCTHPIRISRDICRDLLKACLPYLVAAVMLSLYSEIDRVMIKQMMNSTAEVGYYSAAVTICNLISFIPESLSLSARPVLMEMRQNNASSYNLRVTQVLALIIWFSMLYSVLITIFARWVIQMLYGADYAAAAPALMIMVWSSLFSHLTKIRDLWLLGENQSRLVTGFSFIGVVMNVALNALLIPRYGICGAAVATVVTQAVLAVAAPALFPGTRQFAIDVIHALMLRGVNLRDLVQEVKDALPGTRRRKDHAGND